MVPTGGSPTHPLDLSSTCSCDTRASTQNHITPDMRPPNRLRARCLHMHTPIPRSRYRRPRSPSSLQPPAPMRLSLALAFALALAGPAPALAHPARFTAISARENRSVVECWTLAQDFVDVRGVRLLLLPSPFSLLPLPPSFSLPLPPSTSSSSCFLLFPHPIHLLLSRMFRLVGWEETKLTRGRSSRSYRSATSRRRRTSRRRPTRSTRRGASPPLPPLPLLSSLPLFHSSDLTVRTVAQPVQPAAPAVRLAGHLIIGR